MKIKLSKSVFEKKFLPDIKAEFKTVEAINKAIADGFEITEEDGSPSSGFTYSRTEVQAPGATLDTEALTKSVTEAVTKGMKPLTDAVAKMPTVSGGDVRNDDEGKWGFKTPAEYFKAVAQAGDKSDPILDKRLHKGASAKDLQILKAAPTTYSAEGVNTDGGFTVPPDFRLMVIGDVYENENLLGMCDTMVTESNNVTIPTDETTPWQTTGGVQAYWAGEAANYQQSKVQIKQVNQILQKLTCLVPVTDELLADSFMIAQYVPKKASQKIDWKIGEAIFRGTGAGMPLGFLNALSPTGPTITVAKEISQVAATVVYANVVNMRARVMPSSLKSGKMRWFMQPDTYPQIQSLTLGNYPLFTPPTYGAADAPFGTLQGIPIVLTQHCNTLGTVGDIILADLSQYIAVTKGNAITSQTSMHLWFDQDIVAYKFTFRMAGQPWRSTPVPSQFGTNTLSYFVDLATRS